jgi:hypothetical protein
VSIWQKCSAALREFDIKTTFLGRVLPPSVFFARTHECLLDGL